jgi:hypothetical protein
MDKLLTENQHKLIGELCDYVEANVAPENFDMGAYRLGIEKTVGTVIQELVKENPDTNICGTAGCMMGHAPMCHPELHKTASTFAEVGAAYASEEHYYLWEFMFGGHWNGFQNTPKGSVERIRLALEFDGQVNDDGWDWIVGFTTEEMRASIMGLLRRELEKSNNE